MVKWTVQRAEAGVRCRGGACLPRVGENPAAWLVDEQPQWSSAEMHVVVHVLMVLRIITRY